MAKKTKEDKIRELYYHLNRFNDAMKQHTEYQRTILICQNKKKTLEKNEQGLMREDVAKETGQWADHLVRIEKLAVDQMSLATESYDFLVKAFK